MHMTAIRSLAVWCLFGLAGCALVQEVSKTPRTATEQLLLSHAIEQALAHLALPLPQDTSVSLEVSGLQTDRAQLHLDEQNDKLGVIDNPSWDLAFVRDLVAGRLGELGYRIQTRTNEEVTHVVRVLVQAIGTNQGKTFFGMPPIQSVLIPFSLPQLTLYQELSQLAHALGGRPASALQRDRQNCCAPRDRPRLHRPARPPGTGGATRPPADSDDEPGTRPGSSR